MGRYSPSALLWGYSPLSRLRLKGWRGKAEVKVEVEIKLEGGPSS